MILTNRLRWIESLGGPFVVMDKSLLSSWSGDSDSDIVSFLDNPSDYDRAAEVTDFVGVVDLDEGQVLVLGDLPSPTALLLAEQDRCLFVRWIWAENDEQVIETLQGLEIEESWHQTELNLDFGSGKIVLFDSVFGGGEVSDVITADVQSGRYAVSTRSLQPDEYVNLFLVKLQKI